MLSHLAVLHAAIDRIIPPDDFAGAWDAGVGTYICAQLADPMRHLAPLIEEGLASLEREALHRCGTSFVALSTLEQDHMLAQVETGEVETEWGTLPETFFTLLVRLTNEGYYSDPGEGGNGDEVAWRMIGYRTGVPAGWQ